ncbi:MAG: tRNA pseudouridine synthase B [Candidatus Hepatoplasma vulgare]|nr:MAG: tRNA pseudouridine synthase B [Candidatus Hepatoplasma sp.]
MAFYILNKEKGITSNDLVIKLKKKLNIKSIGHSGTLDPFAEGIIILATEGEKKLLSRFLEERKTYSGKIYFGKTTDTLDPTGKITEEKEIKDLDENILKEIIEKDFLGKIIQTPPIYSAKKINGKKAYEYARESKEISLKEGEKEIYSFSIKKESNNTFSFLIEVSSGTYIRKIAYDLGQKLNIPSMLLELKREKIGNVSLENAQNIEENLKAYSSNELLNFRILNVSKEMIKKVLEGKEVDIPLTEKEIIVKNENIEVLLKKVKKDIYKLEKRLK